MGELKFDLAGLPGNVLAVEDDVIEIGGGSTLLDLPEGAVLLADGSVQLPLQFPRILRTKRAGEEVSSTSYTELVLHRLTGADMRAVFAAPAARLNATAVGKSLRIRASDAAILMDRLDAADFLAANQVVQALLEMGDGLPERAAQRPDGTIWLDLIEAAQDADGVSHENLVFKRMTGLDLTEIARAKEMLPTAIARSTGMNLRQVQALFDNMDGADVVAANRVISFLSGNGRKTGR